MVDKCKKVKDSCLERFFCDISPLQAKVNEFNKTHIRKGIEKGKSIVREIVPTAETDTQIDMVYEVKTQSQINRLRHGSQNLLVNEFFS